MLRIFHNYADSTQVFIGQQSIIFVNNYYMVSARASYQDGQTFVQPFENWLRSMGLYLTANKIEIVIVKGKKITSLRW